MSPTCSVAREAPGSGAPNSASRSRSSMARAVAARGDLRLSAFGSAHLDACQLWCIDERRGIARTV